MKKSIVLLLACLLTLALCACGEASAPAAQAEEEAVKTPEPRVEEVLEAPDAEEAPLEGEPVEAEPQSVDRALLYLADGEEETSGEALNDTFKSNALRYEQRYVGATVILISEVSAIKTDETLFVGDLAYSPGIALHLEGGWIVGLPKSSELAAELDAGDWVKVVGVLTGHTKYGGDNVLINTGGAPTGVYRYDETADGTMEELWTIVNDLADRNYLEMACFLLDDYADKHPGLSEDELSAVSDFMTEIGEMCYEGTFLKTYGEMFGIEDFTQPDGHAYDYTDPLAQSHMQTYGTYLQNQGYEHTGNTSETVDGVTEPYATFTRPGAGTVKMGVGFGDDGMYARVVVTGSSTVTIYTIAGTAYSG